ncbi:MAG: hypothetical protein N0E44_19055 [Candidatus Thiodiazotropha lotti]|nr:hypothetical protein [Candidatus Thiodiazotropha lotti]MCW4221985.1 hypothetical protein [Candidatus Thiodiazotropha lotti]
MDVPKDIVDLVRSSGNNFHARVARWLSEHGWHVIVSPYYMDQVQNKAREIDLIAERMWPIYDYAGRRNSDIAVRLFVECKFIPAYSVFWFADKDLESAKKLVCSTGGFRANNSYTKEHHYLSQGKRVAKLFETNSKKDPDKDPFYKAVNQVLNAMTSMSRRPFSIPGVKIEDRSLQEVMEFPVVVCSSFEKMFSVDFYSESAPTRIENNFQFEVDYAFIEKSGNQRTNYFLLDFVEFDQLSKYFEGISKDAEALAILSSD